MSESIYTCTFIASLFTNYMDKFLQSNIEISHNRKFNGHLKPWIRDGNVTVVKE